jgi:DNA polymerase III subunit alpha
MNNKKIQYCSLHQHSMFSLMDSINSPEAMVKRAKEIGMPAIALTDHGNVHGFIKMHKVCKEAGIKFIPGIEAYWTHNHDDKERKSRHLTILCRNNVGLSNLYKLVTISNTPVANEGGFFYRPRISWRDIEKYHDGLLILSGCMNSPINYEFGQKQDYKVGKEIAEKFIKIIGKNNFFVELQNVNEDDVKYIPEQDIILDYSRKLAKDLGLKCCATNDSHYICKEDSFVHEIWKCVDAKGTLATPIVDPNKGISRGRIVFSGFDYHIKSTDEMLEKFTEEEVATTKDIADMCSVDFELKQDHMPKFDPNTSKEK